MDNDIDNDIDEDRDTATRRPTETGEIKNRDVSGISEEDIPDDVSEISRSEIGAGE
jgi:hypothetical protein